MLKIFGAIYILVAPTLMGILVTALLTISKSSATEITLAAVAGAVVALPISAVVAKRVLALTKGA